MAEPLLRTNRTGAPLEDKRALDMRTDLRSLLAAPMLRGAELAGVALPAAAQVRVPHRLGRTPVGWLVTDATVGVPAFYRVSWDDTVIVFQSTTAATVNLWVW
jgi:hypothetical protein